MPRTPFPRAALRTGPAGLVSVVAALALTACATPPPTGSTASSAPSTAVAPSRAGAWSSGASAAAVPSSSANAAVARGAVAPPSGPAWRPSPGSSAVQVATLPGGDVSLLWMDPARLRFRLVPGYAVPEGSPATAADRTPSTWVPRMLAGFDAGYKLRDHVGGYYYLGRTVSPLRPGYASLVVHQDGSLAVGTWGRDIGMTADTVVVRQNLRPLVLDGVTQASPADGPRTWGISNGNRARANRSALGRLPDGTLVFVYAHDVTAAGLADVLVSLGVREAIDLDMNVSWPTGFVYSHRAGTVVGQKINPHIVRSPSTYLSRFKKDFVVVEPR